MIGARKTPTVGFQDSGPIESEYEQLARGRKLNNAYSEALLRTIVLLKKSPVVFGDVEAVWL